MAPMVPEKKPRSLVSGVLVVRPQHRVVSGPLQYFHCRWFDRRCLPTDHGPTRKGLERDAGRPCNCFKRLADVLPIISVHVACSPWESSGGVSSPLPLRWCPVKLGTRSTHSLPCGVCLGRARRSYPAANQFIARWIPFREWGIVNGGFSPVSVPLPVHEVSDQGRGETFGL